MQTYQLTSAVLGLLVAGCIMWMVRRDHLHGKYALWWIIVAAAFILFGFIPGLVDVFARFLGVAYPPILVVLVGLAALVVKMVTMDVERSREMVKLQRLAQRLAILEGRLDQRQDRDIPSARRLDSAPGDSEPD